LKAEKFKRRLLTSEFSVGDTVYVIRTRHGWYNGEKGVITHLTDDYAAIDFESGGGDTVTHCRDMTH
jgi:transcription elongation factor